MADDSPKITEADAYHRFPDAETPQAACAGAKVVDGAKDEWRKRVDSIKTDEDRDRVKVEVVEAALANLSDKELHRLPNSAKVFLASRVPNTDEGYTTQAKALSASYYASMGFASWEEEAQAKFYRALDKDPLVSEAQQRWNDKTFGDDDRLEVARRIHQLQMSAFGAKQAPISLVDDTRNHGMHSSRDHDIRLSRSPNMGINNPVFSDFVDTVSHESLHSIQQQIVSRDAALKGIEATVLEDLKVKSFDELTGDGKGIFAAERARKVAAAFPGDPGGWNRDMEPDGRLAGVVPVFRYQMAEGGYMPATLAGSANYIDNPIETHAFLFGQKTARFINSSSQGRAATLTKLDENAAIDMRIHNSNTREREAILSAPKPCLCT